jgi:glucose dehydrogenase
MPTACIKVLLLTELFPSTWCGVFAALNMSTPIVVGNRMYVSTQPGRVGAIEPETGKEIWSYNSKSSRPREHRAVAWWPATRASHRASCSEPATGD